MNFNPFNTESILYPFRWLIIATLATGGYMTYADMAGARMLNFPQMQQWGSGGPSGPGYHK